MERQLALGTSLRSGRPSALSALLSPVSDSQKRAVGRPGPGPRRRTGPSGPLVITRWTLQSWPSTNTRTLVPPSLIAYSFEPSDDQARQLVEPRSLRSCTLLPDGRRGGSRDAAQETPETTATSDQPSAPSHLPQCATHAAAQVTGRREALVDALVWNAASCREVRVDLHQQLRAVLGVLLGEHLAVRRAPATTSSPRAYGTSTSISTLRLRQQVGDHARRAPSMPAPLCAETRTPRPAAGGAAGRALTSSDASILLTTSSSGGSGCLALACRSRRAPRAPR